jgi:hypothetical protein
VNIDLGLQGVALLVLPGLAFGLIAQLILWRSATHGLWLIGTVAWAVGALFMSEVVFGAETTEENLQPLIDGLLLDEALAGGLVAGIVAVLATWRLTRPAHGGRLAT